MNIFLYKCLGLFIALIFIGCGSDCDYNCEYIGRAITETQVKKVFRDFSPVFPSSTAFLYLRAISGLKGDIFVLKGKINIHDIKELYTSFGFTGNDFTTDENYCQEDGVSPYWNPKSVKHFKSADFFSERAWDRALFRLSFTYENKLDTFSNTVFFYVQSVTYYD